MPGERQRGFSLLELAVVVAIVALLFALAAERLLRYAELAEKAAMEQTVAALKGALGLRFAAFYLQGKHAEIAALSAENPMEWLAEPPPQYLGAFWDPNVNEMERPAWYFERSRMHLVYVPRRRTNLVVGSDPHKRLAFQVVVDFRPNAGPGSSDALNRLGVDPVQPYKWFDELP